MAETSNTEKLEVQLAYQQKALDDLNDALIAQDARVAQLEEETAALKRTLQGILNGEDKD